MDNYYRTEYMKMRTKYLSLETEIMKLNQEIRDLKRKKVVEELNPKNIFGSRTEKFQTNYLKQQNKKKDEIIKNLNKQINSLQINVKDYKEKFSKTLDMLTQCTNDQQVSKEKLSSLRNKVEDLLEDKENQDIMIKKLRKYAKEKLVEIRKMEKEMKKKEKSEKKEEEKKQKEYERKRKEEEQKAKKEAAERKRKLEEEQKKREQERIRREREAARKAAEEEKRRKEKEEEDLKRRQKERVEEMYRKKNEEEKKQELKINTKERIEKEITQKWGRIDLTTLNVYYSLGLFVIGLNLKEIKKLIRKYHPDRVVGKPLEEQIKYELIFNELNKYKKRLGGRKRKTKK